MCLHQLLFFFLRPGIFLDIWAQMMIPPLRRTRGRLATTPTTNPTRIVLTTAGKRFILASLHCLPMRPWSALLSKVSFRALAIGDQFPSPYSFTNLHEPQQLVVGLRSTSMIHRAVARLREMRQERLAHFLLEEVV
jgi:hypothetical protein